MPDLIEATADASLAAKLDEANGASAARDWPRAGALWDELRAAQPQDPHHWLRAGEAYSEAGTLERAERILGEAITLFPDDRWIAYRYARVARFAGDWREVIRRIAKVRHAAPEFWPAWIEYADALAKCGNRADSEAIYRQAVERFPDVYWPNYAVAQLEAERSDPRGAMRIWSELAERFPGQPATAAAQKAAADMAEPEPRAASPAPRSADSATRRMADRPVQRPSRSVKGPGS